LRALTDILESASKWAGYGPFKKWLGWSLRHGTTSALKYKRLFNVEIAYLNFCERQLLGAVNVKSLSNVEELLARNAKQSKTYLDMFHGLTHGQVNNNTVHINVVNMFCFVPIVFFFSWEIIISTYMIYII
jgi:hypothetical protein